MKRKKGGTTKSSDSEFSWPDEKDLAPIRERLSDPNYEGGNLALDPNAPETDRAKYELCQLIARYRRENDLLQKDIAEKIGADESRVSEILRGRIGSFTLDRLIGYAEKLMPKLRIHISAK